MTIVLSTSLFIPRGFDASLLPSLAGTGLRSLELVAERRHFPYHDLAAVVQWKQQFANAGVEIASVQLPRGTPVFDVDPATRESAMLEIELAIDAAETLGARIVVLSLGQPNEAETPEQQTYAEDAIARLSGYASPRGLELACENVNSAITRVDRLARSIENVGRSMVGICIDVPTAAREGNIDAALRAAGRELYHLQFGNDDAAIRLPEIFATLREVNYSGLYVLELTDASAGAKPISALIEFAASGFARLREFTE
ncbi:MAG: sugar phosphate isomerase/epimerase [Planctomycetes bacterium]|nr:sugar phosphate isomerase/epimerase [Planctomycetota bacterium]